MAITQHLKIRMESAMQRNLGNIGKDVAARAVLVLSLAVAALVLSVALPASSADATPHNWGTSEEQQFVAKINQLRSSLGLPTVAVDASLTNASRSWASTMKGEGHIFHANDLSTGVTANWSKLGENVGVGGDVDTLFQAFVDSPLHYDNLVDPAFRFVGVGVVWDGDRMYTTHRFMSVAETPPPPPPTNPVETTVTTSPPPTTTSTTTTTAPPPPPTTAPKAPTAEPAAIATVIASLQDGLT